MSRLRVRSLTRLRHDEEGFGLLETVLATSLMLIVLVMTLTPAMRGMQNLQSSRLVSVAHNLGQAEIEEIRSLEYADVGIAGSNPGGVLDDDYDVTNQGVVYRVRTTVSFEGAVTDDVDVVPQGGDGVEGFWDAGVNYKYVTITVQVKGSTAIDPVQFETIVSPDGMGAHEGFSNVIVDLVKVGEPPGTESLATDWPRVTLIRGAEIESYASTPKASQPFALLTPTTPGTPWIARLGASTSATADPITGWHIRQASITSGEDRVEVGATATERITIEIYKPATLTIESYSDDGSPVDGGIVAITGPGDATPTTYGASSSAHTGVGVWTIAQHNGEPLVGGTYTVTVHAPGHDPVTRTIELPSGYPTTLAHTERFDLVPVPTALAIVDVYDTSVDPGRQIRDAQVTLTGAGLPEPLVLTTDEYGRVELEVPTGTYDLDVSSPTTGHPSSPTTSVTVTASGLARNVVLSRPSGKGAIWMSNAAGATWFSWRLTSQSDSQYVHVRPNAWGRAYIVDDYGRYRVSRRCASGTYKDSQTIETSSSSSSTRTRAYNAAGTAC